MSVRVYWRFSLSGLFSEQGQTYHIETADLRENAPSYRETSTTAQMYLQFILFPFSDDDCVKRFDQQKEQSRTQPPVYRIVLALYDKINANTSMDKEYNPGEDPTEKREESHG